MTAIDRLRTVLGLANVIVQSQIKSFGMLAMAAYGAHCKIEGFAFLPITSFTMACTTAAPAPSNGT